MNIGDFQKHEQVRASRIITESGLEGRELAFMVNNKLMEEVGELSDQLLGKYGLQRKSKEGKYSKEKFEGELCDVIHMVAILAEITGADLAQLLQERVKRKRRD